MSIAVAAPYDALSRTDLEKRVIEFVQSDIAGRWDKSILDQYVNTVIPRSIYLRNAPADGHLLDLGAGDGGLAILKAWPLVTRADLRMHAVSLDAGDRFDLYEDYELGDFEKTLPDFGGLLFDSIVCSHFIEHLADPMRALRFFAARLKPGGTVYLEWPHPVSKIMPSLTVLQALGVNVMTTNFYDDGTHVDAWAMPDIVEGMQAAGLQINACGRVWFDFIADQLLAYGKATSNAVDLTYAVWYKFAWAQYLIASKPLG